MCERRYCLGLPCKTCAHLLILGHSSRKDFDRHPAVETSVGCSEHFTHSARTEKGLDAIRTERGPRAKAERVVKQRCRGLPDRAIQNYRRIVLAKQRFDFAPEAVIVRA